MKYAIFFIFITATVAIPFAAYANGVGWTPGLTGRTPGPATQNALYLEEEHVVMKGDKYTADFKVKNPTKQDITTFMGFPLEVSWISPLEIDIEDELEGRCTDYWRLSYLPINDIKVLVNGNAVSSKVECQKTGDYPIVINWTMTYPAEQVTQFTINYPALPPSIGMDNPGIGGSIISEDKYIVHTGAFWSRPIGKATFEFCNEAAELMCDPQSKETKWSSDGYMSVRKSIDVIDPVHTSINCEKKMYNLEPGKLGANKRR